MAKQQNANCYVQCALMFSFVWNTEQEEEYVCIRICASFIQLLYADWVIGDFLNGINEIMKIWERFLAKSHNNF